MNAKIIRANGIEDAMLATPTLEACQRVVGGYVEMVQIDGGRRQMLVNEEGLLQNLPINAKASALAQRHIVGDVVILAGKARWK
jgi:uncharacterized protein DUF3846